MAIPPMPRSCATSGAAPSTARPVSITNRRILILESLLPIYIRPAMTPSPPTPVLLSWSGGKDSALALDRLRADARYHVVGLLTSVTREYDRISIHGVRRSLLEEQA